MEKLAVQYQSETIVVRLSSETIPITPEHVARYAGGSGYKMEALVSEMASGIVNQAMKLAAPAIAYAVHPVRTLSPEGRMLLEGGLSITVPRPERDAETKFLVASVCTLGPALESACRALANQGDFLRSLLMDAAGVALLEALGQTAHHLLSEQASREGLSSGCRIAPGCGPMPMSSQALLFELVDADTIAVRLNESMIMNPNKSISFFVRWTKKVRFRSNAYKCETCSLQHCQFRLKEGSPGCVTPARLEHP